MPSLECQVGYGRVKNPGLWLPLRLLLLMRALPFGIPARSRGLALACPVLMMYTQRQLHAPGVHAQLA